MGDCRKVLAVGKMGTGKSSIINRYVKNVFSSCIMQTLGVDFALKTVRDGAITLQIWDVAGQERYSHITRVYYRDASAAMVVCDVMQPDSFENAVTWKADIDRKVFLPNNESIPCVLVVNKCDKRRLSEVKSEEEMEQFCADNGFVTWFETSAKANINISAVFERLVDCIIDNDATLAKAAIDQNFVLVEKPSIPYSSRKSKRCKC
eukprot:TRINITY_DN19268_c2_g2_i1.p1 TRINITY_DN19268_c2_g2~~TRINITY_DN19268_c2_g2_i1.p1  ORF type:complete len:218 (+),score=52.43 TRINITY_DN19268_c2_g2_i1:37-654(+)